MLLLIVRSAALAADAALHTVSLARAKDLSTTGLSGQSLFRLKSAPEDAASALRTLQTFALVFAAGLAAYAGSYLPVPQWAEANIPGLGHLVGPFGGVLIGAVLATLTDLIFRALAVASGERPALRAARPVRALSGGVSAVLR